MTVKRRQEHGYSFESMVKEHLGAEESPDIRFDLIHDDTPMQIKTTGDKSLRLGRYKSGLEISNDFYLVYAIHDNYEIVDVKSYLINGLDYNRQFSFEVQGAFDELIKPLPDRTGMYKEYCTQIKAMAQPRLVCPAVKKGGGGNNRLQSYIQIKDVPELGVEVDLGLEKFLNNLLK